MKRHHSKFLFLVLCSIFGGFIFTTVLCEQENIPISSELGKTLKEWALNSKQEFTQEDMLLSFFTADTRSIENNPVYAFLYMDMDKINKNTGRTLLNRQRYKSSGTVLYRSDDYILVLTAYRNLHDEDTPYPDHALETSMMWLIKDNRDQNNPPYIISAQMVGYNYIQIAQKDIALVAMKLYEEDVFENDKAMFDILDFKNIQQPGQGNDVNAEINQYSTYFAWYIKTIGSAYHENGKGYHYIPTLPGSRGSAVVVNGKIAGVHTSSGRKLPDNEVNIRYNNNNILVENNIFELISLDEIKQESIKLKNNTDKTILANLIQKYIDELNRQNNAHVEL